MTWYPIAKLLFTALPRVGEKKFGSLRTKCDKCLIVFFLSNSLCTSYILVYSEWNVRALTYLQGSLGLLFKDEPAYDKTNKLTMRPVKTQISLGIRPVWSESSLSAWRKLGSVATHWAQAKSLIRLGGCPSSDLSLRWAHMSVCWFCHGVAKMQINSWCQ